MILLLCMYSKCVIKNLSTNTFFNCEIINIYKIINIFNIINIQNPMQHVYQLIVYVHVSLDIIFY